MRVIVCALATQEWRSCARVAQCSICRTEFEDDEMVRVLPCKHCEHDECLGQWLKMSKCCPLCNAEVPA
jgi:hypothetical protein